MYQIHTEICDNKITKPQIQLQQIFDLNYNSTNTRNTKKLKPIEILKEEKPIHLPKQNKKIKEEEQTS